MNPGRLFSVSGLLDRTPAAYVVLLGTVLLTLLAWYYMDQNVGVHQPAVASNSSALIFNTPRGSEFPGYI